MKKDSFIKVIGIVSAMVFCIGACSLPAKSNTSEKSITIAEQYGLAYAPLEIVKEQKLLEKNLPGVKVSWRQLGNTAAIREAMMAGEVDAGFMAIPPFLIGYDKGMKWGIFSGLSSVPTALVSNNPRVLLLGDISSSDRIALPQPGSVQHILLSMACEKQFGDAHRFDNILVTLSHPDATNALLSGKDITAHFTTPPYMQKELASPGIHIVLDGKEALGKDFTFIVGVAAEAFRKGKTEAYQAMIKSVDEAVEYIKANPDQSIKILAKAYGMEEKEVKEYMNTAGASYSTEVSGIKEFGEFMSKNGYIKNMPAEKDIVWDDEVHEK